MVISMCLQIEETCGIFLLMVDLSVYRSLKVGLPSFEIVGRAI